MFYSFQSDWTKIGGVTLIRNGLFTTRQMSKRGSTSPARRRSPLPPFLYIFWAFWTWRFTMYHIKYTRPIKKDWENRDWVIVFFGYFWWFCPDYIGKSAIFKIWVFWVISMYFITLYIIDIHNISCLEPFWPLYGHFEISRFLGLNWQY